MTNDTQMTLAQLEAIRRSGLTNMMDKTTVQRIAYECEFFGAVTFIEDADGGEYIEAIERASAEFDNAYKGLPVDEVPDELTFETTVTLG